MEAPIQISKHFLPLISNKENICAALDREITFTNGYSLIKLILAEQNSYLLATTSPISLLEDGESTTGSLGTQHHCMKYKL